MRVCVPMGARRCSGGRSVCWARGTGALVGTHTGGRRAQGSGLVASPRPCSASIHSLELCAPVGGWVDTYLQLALERRGRRRQ